MKKIITFRLIFSCRNSLVATVFLLINEAFSQSPTSIKPPAEDNTWWYFTLFILAAGLAGAIFWKISSKKRADDIAQKAIQSKQTKGNADGLSFDADAEIEWLRKNQNVVNRRRQKAPKKAGLNLPKTREVFSDARTQDVKKIFDDLDSIPLPVFDFKKMEPAKAYDQLSLSNDEALLCAIEQTHDEYEEDEEVRGLAVRILAAFRTRNSIESLSQVAIYDLSSSLRSKAVLILTEFDHESVFETILLACADPTREVRAAAARGLTRLSFDRGDAWARIMEINEKGRMRHAARAAIESGFVERSFDRLIHRDPKYSYEAFALLSFIVKSGETELLFESLKTCKDKLVRTALLHVLMIAQDQNVLSYLYTLLEDKSVSSDLRGEIDKAITEMSLVAA